MVSTLRAGSAATGAQWRTPPSGVRLSLVTRRRLEPHHIGIAIMLEKPFRQPRIETIQALRRAASGTPLALREIVGHRVAAAMHQLRNPMRRMALPVQCQHRIRLLLSLYEFHDLAAVCHRQDGIGQFLAHNIT